MAYIGWLALNRDELLQEIEPTFPDVVAHHVTYKMLAKGEVLADFDLQPTEGKIIDVVQSDKVQALVVQIDGSEHRPDGGIYHITWSIDREAGAKPVHSNKVIADLGYEKKLNIPVRLYPFTG